MIILETLEVLSLHFSGKKVEENVVPPSVLSFFSES